jgi:hypothetical protein
MVFQKMSLRKIVLKKSDGGFNRMIGAVQSFSCFFRTSFFPPMGKRRPVQMPISIPFGSGG